MAQITGRIFRAFAKTGLFAEATERHLLEGETTFAAAFHGASASGHANLPTVGRTGTGVLLVW